jgi:hypothetical protein
MNSKATLVAILSTTSALSLGCAPTVRIGVTANATPAVIIAQNRNSVAVEGVDGSNASVSTFSKIVLFPYMVFVRGQRIEVQPGNRELFARATFKRPDHQVCVGTARIKTLLEPRKLYRIGGDPNGQFYSLWLEDVGTGLKTTAEAAVSCVRLKNAIEGLGTMGIPLP